MTSFSHLHPRGSTSKLITSHGVFQSPQCIPLVPTGEILTDKDRIGKYFVQDSQGGKGGARKGSRQEGRKKSTVKGSVKGDKDPRPPDTPVEWDILGLTLHYIAMEQAGLMERCHN